LSIGGQVALSANGDTVLWSSTSNGVIRSQYTDAFTDVTTLPSGAAIASDKLNNSIFYAASGSEFYTSKDGGLTFSVTGSLSGSSSAFQVIVNPNVTGDVWISGSGGLYHSSSLGAAPVSVGPITEAVSVHVQVWIEHS
jgi:xyloglucan-specific exo-beta-1,4-glucanase